MLLQHLNDFASSRKLLDNLAFKSKAVRWIITLDDAGNLVGRGPVETEGEKRRGKEFSCPQTTRPKVAGGVAEFMADGITAVFGLDTDPEKSMSEKKRKGRDENNRDKYDDFWTQIEQAHKKMTDPLLKALLAFKSEPGRVPSFLRWGVSSDAKPKEKPAWWITKANGEEVKLGPDNFSFRVEGQLLIEDTAYIRPFWRRQFEKETEAHEADAPRGLCLVTGESDQPIALTHNPKVQGVPNTQAFGAAIVSFDKDAFASYGFEQSLNASTSTRAATAYCTALNAMLDREDHSIRLGQASCCFWTRNETDATSAWGALLNQANPKAVAGLPEVPLDRAEARGATAGAVSCRHSCRQQRADRRAPLDADDAGNRHGKPAALVPRPRPGAGAPALRQGKDAAVGLVPAGLCHSTRRKGFAAGSDRSVVSCGTGRYCALTHPAASHAEPPARRYGTRRWNGIVEPLPVRLGEAHSQSEPKGKAHGNY